MQKYFILESYLNVTCNYAKFLSGIWQAGANNQQSRHFDFFSMEL